MLPTSLQNTLRLHWRSLLLALLLGFSAWLMSYSSSLSLGTVLCRTETSDVWFNADVKRVQSNMTQNCQARSEVHPLFALAGYTPVYLADRLFHAPRPEAARWVVASVASAWIISLFFLLRLIGCRPWDTALFCLLALSSASALFFFAVPETYGLGSLTILLCLLPVALVHKTRSSEMSYIAASALSLSITVTNWMVGIVSAFTVFSWKRALRVTLGAFLVVTALWGVQKLLVPTSKYFLQVEGESRFLASPNAGRWINVTGSFLCHGMVAPALKSYETEDSKEYGWWSILTTQGSPPGSGTGVGIVATLCWLVLLGIGSTALFRLDAHREFRIVLGTAITGQFFLHLVYGKETFLYSLHYFPLLVMVAALGSLTSKRRTVLALTLVVILGAGFNNLIQFQKARAYLSQPQVSIQQGSDTFQSNREANEH